MANLDLTEKQLKDGCKKCIENVQNLLSSAKLLLSDKNSHQFALGLYMYAIEEYGKAEILKGYVRQNKTTYSISGWIFGRGRGPGRRNSHEVTALVIGTILMSSSWYSKNHYLSFDIDTEHDVYGK